MFHTGYNSLFSRYAASTKIGSIIILVGLYLISTAAMFGDKAFALRIYVGVMSRVVDN